MSAARSRAPAILDRIAAHLNVPVEAFSAPLNPKVSESIAVLAMDPEGQQLAEAFAALPPHLRSALTRTAGILVNLSRDVA